MAQKRPTKRRALGVGGRPTAVESIEYPKNNHSGDYTIDDAVIEQWYTDPYERVDPDGSAHNIQCAKHLAAIISNQGFSFIHTNAIVNWLTRCNGRFQPFLTRAERHAAIAASREEKKANIKGRKNMKATSKTLDRPRTPPPKTTRSDIEKNKTSKIGGHDREDYMGFLSEDEEGEIVDHDEEEQKVQKILATAGRDGSMLNLATTPAKRTNSSSEDYHDKMIRALNARLRFWDIIYGKQLPAPNPHIEFNHLHRPVPKPLVRTRTQNHHALHPVRVNDTATFAEDPTFGLTTPPAPERATPEERDAFTRHVRQTYLAKQEAEIMQRLNADEARRDEETDVQRVCAGGKWNGHDEGMGHFSNGYRETWREILARRARAKAGLDGG